MNTLLVCLAVPAYLLVGLLVCVLVDVDDEIDSSLAFWGCVLLWPAIVLAVIATYILAAFIVLSLLTISIVQKNEASE